MSEAIPKEKVYPGNAVQCDGCGGYGCDKCGDKGWVLYGDPNARKCLRPDCPHFIRPHQIAVYCSNRCAFLDAERPYAKE